ncbi:TraG family conjugative transposon ATPase [Alistipes ihumii]|uniref:TraG family conjugative transposon ATPase n=1 Tax=Alistipes ihumii TaxID=1470347 RepID=UPI003FEFE22A
MYDTLKVSTLESKFPLFSVEHDCIVSKEADLTVGFRVTLPEIFTVSSAEYEAMHGTWLKAIKVLPHYTILHKQDWFIAETYRPDSRGDLSFLSRCYERHFIERPYLYHTCYLFITKTVRERSRRRSDWSTLCRGMLVPKESRDPEMTAMFMDAVGQFVGIVNESGYLHLEQLRGTEIVGTENRAGIIEKYFALTQQDRAVMQDIRLDPGRMQIGDDILCLHTLSDLDDLPQRVSTDLRYERLSTDRSDCRLSYAAPVGLLLGCNHVYNQYVMIDDHTETLRRFERSARNLQSLSRYSRANAFNKEWLDLYLNEAHSLGLTSVRCHFNVLAWSEDRDRIKKIKTDVGSALSQMECRPRHNTVDVPTLFWAAIPGNEADFPSEETFYTFMEQALCFFTAETNYRDSPSPFGIKLCDRLSGRPVHLDISDEPMRRGIITNRNKFVLGPSGSGKSFYMNHLSRQYYEQGAHLVIVDTGNSYKGLCDLIHERTHGEDGIYFTYTEDDPISFNPFYAEDRLYDVEKRESIKTLIMTLWKREDEAPRRSEEVALSNAVNLYILSLQRKDAPVPCFDTFYEYVRDTYRKILERKRVREKDFDLDNFLNVLEPYYKGGEYDYLLNSGKGLDLLNKRFIVFELDNIKEHKILFPVTTLVIMETFIGKMRRLKGTRKVIVIEEAWKALAKEGMAGYIKYLFKTVRKFYGEAVVVTQEVDDIISSPIVKESIINNADCKILLDQRKYMQKFGAIQSLLSLTDKERDQILSINLNNDARRHYKEVWIGLGGVLSAVYATEVSAEEYSVYTTEEKEKIELLTLTDRMDGDMQQAVRQLTENKRNKSLT